MKQTQIMKGKPTGKPAPAPLDLRTPGGKTLPY